MANTNQKRPSEREQSPTPPSKAWEREPLQRKERGIIKKCTATINILNQREARQALTVAELYHCIYKIHSDKKQFQEACDFLLKSIFLQEEYKGENLKLDLEALESQRKQFVNFISQNEQIRDVLEIVRDYLMLGQVHKEMVKRGYLRIIFGDKSFGIDPKEYFGSALDYYRRAIEIIESGNVETVAMRKQLGTAYQHMGEIHSDQNTSADMLVAISYFEKALPCFEGTKNHSINEKIRKCQEKSQKLTERETTKPKNRDFDLTPKEKDELCDVLLECNYIFDKNMLKQVVFEMKSTAVRNNVELSDQPISRTRNILNVCLSYEIFDDFINILRFFENGSTEMQKVESWIRNNVDLDV